jgi:hypothetical protein
MTSRFLLAFLLTLPFVALCQDCCIDATCFTCEDIAACSSNPLFSVLEAEMGGTGVCGIMHPTTMCSTWWENNTHGVTNGDPATLSNPYGCISPCGDPLACNYDSSSPFAVVESPTCDYGCHGCTDLNACNYEPQATDDDGTCIPSGCMDPSACNYLAAAGCDDGNCNYSCCPGPACCGPGTAWDWSTSSCVPSNPNLEGICSISYDGNSDGIVGISDLLGLLAVFGDSDSDDDGIWDSLDACTDSSACNYAESPSVPCAWLDAIQICGGDCEGDEDADGICDDEDNCVGVIDECGICNGPGPTEMVIESITILYDSVYAAPIDQWFVFEVGADTVMSFQCAELEWNQVGNDIDGDAGSYSGASVAISNSGDVVAIGAYNAFGDDINDGWYGTNAGHVRVYSWNGEMWAQVGDDIDGEWSYDESGWSVAISADGQIVAIGAVTNDGGGDASGHVRVYSWNDEMWTQMGADIDGEAASDMSGWSVSLSANGGTVAISARGNEGNGSLAGHTRVYSFDGSIWNQMGADIDGEPNDRSGDSVSLSSDGNTLAVGSASCCGNAGKTIVYSWITDMWVQKGQVLFGESSWDASGFSLSLSNDGNTLAIGGPANDGNGNDSGHVRIYSWNGTSWSQKGNDIDGEAMSDDSGDSVSLSNDGNTVAIGAWRNGGNGYESGHVRVYHFDGSEWVQLGQDMDGEAPGDHSGSAVSISSDGTKVAIGAQYNSDNGSHSGQVRVYSFD